MTSTPANILAHVSAYLEDETAGKGQHISLP